MFGSPKNYENEIQTYGLFYGKIFIIQPLDYDNPTIHPFRDNGCQTPSTIYNPTIHLFF